MVRARRAASDEWLGVRAARVRAAAPPSARSGSPWRGSSRRTSRGIPGGFSGRRRQGGRRLAVSRTGRCFFREHSSALYPASNSKAEGRMGPHREVHEPALEAQLREVRGGPGLLLRRDVGFREGREEGPPDGLGELRGDGVGHLRAAGGGGEGLAARGGGCGCGQKRGLGVGGGWIRPPVRACLYCCGTFPRKTKWSGNPWRIQADTSELPSVTLRDWAAPGILVRSPTAGRGGRAAAPACGPCRGRWSGGRRKAA